MELHVADVPADAAQRIVQATAASAQVCGACVAPSALLCVSDIRQAMPLPCHASSDYSAACSLHFSYTARGSCILLQPICSAPKGTRSARDTEAYR